MNLFFIPIAPVGPPQVSVLNTSATWINIMWSPPFDPENVTLGFGLTYQLINSSLLTSTPRPQTAITNIARHLTLLTLQPLLKASQYRIVMYTITAQGTSPASNKLLVSTKQYGTHKKHSCLYNVINNCLLIYRCKWSKKLYM